MSHAHTKEIRVITSEIPAQLAMQGVTASGSCMLARGFMAAREDIRSSLLEIAWGLTAAKSVARPGDPVNWKDSNSQLLLGAMWGEDRSTMNRHLAQFSATVCGRCYGRGKVLPGDRGKGEENADSVLVSQESSASPVDARDRAGIQLRGLEAQGSGDSVHHSSATENAGSGSDADSQNGRGAEPELITCPKCNGAGVRDAEIFELLHKWRPAIGCVNNYEFVRASDEATAENVSTRNGKDAGTKSGKKEKKDHPLNDYNPVKLAEIWPEFFDKDAEGLNGCFEAELWILDPNIRKTIRCGCRKGQMKFVYPGVNNCLKCGGNGFTLHPTDKMGASARKVLLALRSKGLASYFKDRETGAMVFRGYLEKTCAEIGEMCGLSVNTVADALDQWEDHKVLQIVPGKVIYEDFNDPKTGLPAIKCRLPQRIIWLPGLLLDPAMMQREKQRFGAHLIATREKALLNGWACAGIHLDRIQKLHNELLRRWCMSRHSLGAFWRAMRLVIYREGIPSGQLKGEPDYRNELFPINLYKKLE